MGHHVLAFIGNSITRNSVNRRIIRTLHNFLITLNCIADGHHGYVHMAVRDNGVQDFPEKIKKKQLKLDFGAGFEKIFMTSKTPHQNRYWQS